MIAKNSTFGSKSSRKREVAESSISRSLDSRKRETLGLAQAFEISKPTFSDTLPSPWPHPLIMFPIMPLPGYQRLTVTLREIVSFEPPQLLRIAGKDTDLLSFLL